jgi:hypothetical protein
VKAVKVHELITMLATERDAFLKLRAEIREKAPGGTHFVVRSSANGAQSCSCEYSGSTAASTTPLTLSCGPVFPYQYTAVLSLDRHSFSREDLLQLAREAEANRKAHHCSHLCHDAGSRCMADGHLLLEPGEVNMNLRANCPGIIRVMIKGVLEDVQTCSHTPPCLMPHVTPFSLKYVPSPYAVNFNKQLK